jgi:hypothetical protein
VHKVSEDAKAGQVPMGQRSAGLGS